MVRRLESGFQGVGKCWGRDAVHMNSTQVAPSPQSPKTPQAEERGRAQKGESGRENQPRAGTSPDPKPTATPKQNRKAKQSGKTRGKNTTPKRTAKRGKAGQGRHTKKTAKRGKAGKRGEAHPERQNREAKPTTGERGPATEKQGNPTLAPEPQLLTNLFKLWSLK